jgi:3-oxoacyl-[acyl-carrier protein] reductase
MFDNPGIPSFSRLALNDSKKDINTAKCYFSATISSVKHQVTCNKVDMPSRLPINRSSDMTAHLSLQGKTAIVTGASRGIGASVALKLASRGADVVLTYTSASSKKLVADMESEIQSLPHTPKSLSISANLKDVNSPRDIVNSIIIWRGGPEKTTIDILVNNAGMEMVKPLGEIQPEDFEEVYNLNVRAPILLMQASLPYLPRNGRVINIGSVGGRAGFSNLSLYCSSKAALEGLTRSWAAELGHNGTTVNCVNPGPVQSEMLDNIPKDIVEAQKKSTPIEKRLGTKEEIADVVAWLAGPESRWVTGQTLSMSGGWAMY